MKDSPLGESVREEYPLQLEDRMKPARYEPEFMFPGDIPKGLKVLVILPHPYEAAKIGGILLLLLDPKSGNRVHSVVVFPSHRGVSRTGSHRVREDLINAARKEGLDWFYLIGLRLGLPRWEPGRPLKNPQAELPAESEYPQARDGDQFIYGPDGAYRFFNAWRTYDTGEKDPNAQRVVRWDQDGFATMVALEDPDLVLLPDQLDPHPSQRTAREMALESLRRLLAARHARGETRDITLLECPSFQLLSPPRYNLWALAPKEIADAKNLASRALRSKLHHNFPAYQMMAERVVSMRTLDEYIYSRHRRGRSPFDFLPPESSPPALPEDITSESFTVSRLFVDTTGGAPVVREARVDSVQRHFAAISREPCPG